MKPLGAGVPTPKVRVLIADDAFVIANTLATILDLGGYDVCALYDGQAALKLLNLLKPDLIITDVTSAGLTGVETHSVEYLELPRCKVLLFTGPPSLHEILRADDALDLSFDLVIKPIRPSDLLAKLRASLCSSFPPLLIPIETDETEIH